MVKIGKYNRVESEPSAPLLISIALILFLFFLNISVIIAAPIPINVFNNYLATPGSPWHVTADYFSYDGKENTYELNGNVILQRNHIKIKTKSLSFNHKNMTVEANHGALVSIEKDSLTCETLKFNLRKETGTIDKGYLFLQENNLQIAGSKIEKISKDTYTINNGTLTTCNNENPAWTISGQNIQIKKGAHGTLKHAVLKVKKIPVLYLPYLIFPTEKRQSGLLSPEIRYIDNTVRYCQPFFLKISENSDMTFYPNYVFGNGLFGGLEYRCILENSTKGLFMLDWAKNKRNSKSNYYWIRSKFTKELSANFTAKLGIDIVHGIKCLDDHKEGYTGFNKTEQHFKSFMEKDLTPCNGNSRNNYLILSRTWSNFAFNTALYFNSVPIRRRALNNENIPHSLLTIQFDSSRHRLMDSPFYFSVNLKHKNFDCKCIDEKHITEFKPRIYIPLIIGNFISIDMSMGSQQIMLNHGNHKCSSKSINNYDFKLDMLSEFSKVFKKTKKNMGFLKHSIKIRTIYEYGPEKNNVFFNYLDENHYKNYENSITYSITNSLYTKLKHKKKTGNGKYDYKQLIYLNLEQRFSGKNENKPFSDITGKLDLTFSDNLTLKTHAIFDAYNGTIPFHDMEIYIQNNKNYCAMLGYLYEKNKKKLCKTSISAPLSERLTATMTCGYNFLENKKTEESLRLNYDAPCWSANISYKNNERRGSRSISLSIEFSGIGTHNNRIKAT